MTCFNYSAEVSIVFLDLLFTWKDYPLTLFSVVVRTIHINNTPAAVTELKIDLDIDRTIQIA